MRPLAWIAMGLVVVVLHADVGGFDLYPDPVGWLLVLLGTRALPVGLPRRPALLWLATVAFAVAAVLYVPALDEIVRDAGPAVAWAADLPRFAYAALLCADLGARARPVDRRAAGWLGVVKMGVVVIAVLPVLVFGAGLTDLGPTAAFAAQVVSVALVVVLFTYSGREWSRQMLSDSAAEQRDSS